MENMIESLSWIDSAAATVWILLSLIMFWILYKLYESVGSTHPTFRFGVFLIILVWLYPVYTYLLNQLEVGLAGNILTLAATVMYMKKLKKILPAIAKWMIPQIIWLILATIYVGAMVIMKFQMA